MKSSTDKLNGLLCSIKFYAFKFTTKFLLLYCENEGDKQIIRIPVEQLKFDTSEFPRNIICYLQAGDNND